MNAARQRANAIFSTQLKSVNQYFWECCAPHDQDPSWPACLERAIYEKSLGSMPFEFAFNHWQRFRKTRIAIEQRAAELLREISLNGDRTDKEMTP